PFFFQAEDGIRDRNVTGVQTCALPIYVPLLHPGLRCAISCRTRPGYRMGRTATGDPRQTRRSIMTKRRRIGLLSCAAVLAAGALAGCGLGTAGGYVPSGELSGPVEDIDLDGAEIAVGAKDFTEQISLGKMAVILLQSAGADAQGLTNVPGSNSVRMAMEEDIMDFQWDYTGTAWITYMGEVDPLTDEYEQYEAVRDADL